jgi:hypothetical protein
MNRHSDERRIEYEIRRELRTEEHLLRDILQALRNIEYLVLELLRRNPFTTAKLTVISARGAIDMAQSTLKSTPGTDTITFQVFDNSNPPVDITARCTFTAVSDGPAVVLGAVAGSTVPATYTPGTANVAITATDSGGDTIQPLTLAATITAPAAGTITVTASNPATTIA